MKKILFLLYSKISILLFRLQGIEMKKGAYISRRGFSKIGKGKLVMKENAQINSHCFLLSSDYIIIGRNSTLAYQVSVLTSANPNYPYNALKKLYPPLHAPVVIGDDVWIGARSVILPGVKIGNKVVVAAGAVVTQDIPDNVLVAGVPAKIKRKLEL